MAEERKTDRERLKELHAELTLAICEDETPDDVLMVAVLASPTGPALSDFHPSARAAYREAAQRLGLVEPTFRKANPPATGPTPGRQAGVLIQFPVSRPDSL